MPFDFITIPSDRQINERKLEGWFKYNQIRQWGLKNPIEFQRQFMKIEMLDLQKYVFINTWNADFAVWLMCRNAGKTTVGSLYTMTRSVLIPFHETYILGKTGAQSKEMYRKIENIAKRQIESFTGSTEFFLEEVSTKGTVGDGFGHDPASFRCELFNGAGINTLNSDPDNVRGKRANLVYFDEAGWFSDELFVQGENFVNQDSDFKMGVGVDMRLEPKNFTRQLIYGSSASDTDSGYYTKVKNFTREMMMGNRKYFVCNFDVNVIMSATKNGEPYAPLISQSKVDKLMREDPERGMRELYNKFTSGSYEGQIITPRLLMQYTTQTPPVLQNDETNKRFMLAWDSARMHDNSVIIAAELVNDPTKGLCMNIANVISLVDDKLKERTPKTWPEQSADFKKILLRYNGSAFGKLDYENIEAIIGDAGAGGGMIGVADYLLPDWKDENGQTHKGLIDSQHNGYNERVYDFSNAVDIFHLIEPRKYRNDIFTAIGDMVKLGVVTFPADYDDKDYLALIDENGVERRYDLTIDEQVSLTQIEALKKEVRAMCKYVNGDNVIFNYPPDLRNKMHDDRVFAFGLLCFWLSKLRHGQAIMPSKPKENKDRPATVSRAYEDDE